MEPRKSGWWKEPENKTALALLGIVAAGVLYLWGMILPFIIGMLADTLHMIFLGLILAAVLSPLWSLKVRYLLRMVNRWITSWFVAIDPIGIRENYLDDARENKQIIEERTGTVRGLRIKLREWLGKNQSDYDDCMRKLQVASATIKSGTAGPDVLRQANRLMATESKKASMLDGLIKTRTAHLAHYDQVITVLARYGEICDDAIADLANEIEIEKQKEEESKSFASAIRAVGKILRGGTPQAAMDAMARQELEDRYASRLGEVESFLDATKSVVANADFNDQAALAEAQQRIDTWASKDLGLPMGKDGSTKAKLLMGAGPSINVSVATAQPSAVDEYFK